MCSTRAENRFVFRTRFFSLPTHGNLQLICIDPGFGLRQFLELISTMRTSRLLLLSTHKHMLIVSSFLTNKFSNASFTIHMHMTQIVYANWNVFQTAGKRSAHFRIFIRIVNYWQNHFDVIIKRIENLRLNTPNFSNDIRLPHYHLQQTIRLSTPTYLATSPHILFCIIKMTINIDWKSVC